jgi:hypothetical protein
MLENSLVAELIYVASMGNSSGTVGFSFQYEVW